MKIETLINASSLCGALILANVILSGCETTNAPTAPASANTSIPAKSFPAEYRTDDGRTIEIGRAKPDDGGWRFKEPHLDKCWIADGFNFTGYDAIYIAPTVSTAKIHDDEKATQKLAKENLVIELKRMLAAKGLFPHVIIDEAAIPANGRVLRMENTIVEFAKGGGAARYFVGLYGGGQPKLRVRGKMTDGEKVVFEFEGFRSGTSAGARISGAFMKDEDIQIDDIRSLILDLTDFMAAIAGKYTPRN